MENAEILSVAGLKVKLTSLNGELRKINGRRDEITQEIAHIEYVLNHFSRKKDETVTVSPFSEKPIIEAFDRKEVIEVVLKESQKVMTSSQVRDELKKRGTPIPQDSFNAIMSVESKKPSSNIEKVGYGKYRYKGDKSTPSPTSLAGANDLQHKAASTFH